MSWSYTLATKQKQFAHSVMTTRTRYEKRNVRWVLPHHHI